ncbi:MAG: hypothetical protein LBO72_09440 [Helicobacteraceae bacterium]|jgi:uncharacterized protein YwgA|nr:hypothetical protein [Helicobacteraceae bacterium]
MTKEKQIIEVIRVAGGKFVGRTRLQKTCYLLSLIGDFKGFNFGYYHYGPYSEDLTETLEIACAFGGITEKVERTNWGALYSIYNVDDKALQENSISKNGSGLIEKAKSSDSVILELAATAAYFATQQNKDPWKETSDCKPEKSDNGRLEQAKALYAELRNIAPELPAIS